MCNALFKIYLEPILINVKFRWKKKYCRRNISIQLIVKEKKCLNNN